MVDDTTRKGQEQLYGTAKYWQRELEQADQYEEEWRDRATQVVERYRDERGTTNGGIYNNISSRFNILWSNVETLKGALFSRIAAPDVRRRWSDPNPAGRQVAKVLERSLKYELDIYDSDDPIEAALQDYLLVGRGVCWVVYEPIIVKDTVETTSTILDGDELVETTDKEVIERLGDQRCRIDYVNWQDYRESPSRRSEDRTWVARRHLLTRDELISRGFKNASEIPLNWAPSTDSSITSPSSMDVYQTELYARAEVFEIWDYYQKKRIFIATGYDVVLAEDDDPYGLEQFFPCPTPLIAVKTNNTSIPIPEYTLYQDQAIELDRITSRITNLIEALKRRGVYDSSIPELAKLSSASDNTFIPAESFSSLSQKGGLSAAFQTEDISSIASVVSGLYQQRNAILQTIYEITGISDIIRGGSTKASETATAQQLKTQYGSMRIRRRQDDIQKYIRNLFRIKAEIIAENYEPETLQRMTNIEVTPEMLQIMRDDKTRGYVIDIESDSTVFADDQEEKRTRIEFANTMGSYLVQALQVTKSAPEVTPLAFEILKFVSGAWKVGRNFEDIIDDTERKTLQQLEQLRSQPPGPSPEEIQKDKELQTQLAIAKLKEEGKLSEIQSRERSLSEKLNKESLASQQRSTSKEDIAMLDAELALYNTSAKDI